MTTLDTRPARVDNVFRPGEVCEVEFSWPTGEASGSAFTATLDGTSLAVNLIGDAVTVTASAVITDAVDSPATFIMERDGDTVIVGRWVASHSGSGARTSSTTVVVQDASVSVSVVSGAAAVAALEARVDDLTENAPAALNTFYELSAALADDANFAATMLAALAGKQPVDADLTAIAALSTTSYGRAFLTLANAAAARTAIDAPSNADLTAVAAAAQPVDADLTAIAALTTTSYGRSFLALADAAAARTLVDVPSTGDLTAGLAGKQPLDTDLTAIAALTTTSYGRAFLALADAAAARTAIDAPSTTDLSTGLAARQPLDADLTALAALSTTSFGRALLELADAAAGRSALGLGSAATMTPATIAADSALTGTFMVYVGTAASPVSSAGQARPTTSGPVYWLCAHGIVPTNAADGDLIWNASA